MTFYKFILLRNSDQNMELIVKVELQQNLTRRISRIMFNESSVNMLQPFNSFNYKNSKTIN